MKKKVAAFIIGFILFGVLMASAHACTARIGRFLLATMAGGILLSVINARRKDMDRAVRPMKMRFLAVFLGALVWGASMTAMFEFSSFIPQVLIAGIGGGLAALTEALCIPRMQIANRR